MKMERTIPFSIIGVLILAHTPRHVVGWLFTTTGALSSLQGVLAEYTYRTLFTAASELPGGEFTAWLVNRSVRVGKIDRASGASGG